MNILKPNSIGAVLFAVVLLSSCTDNPESPGRTFMPDMTYSQAYETYTTNPNFEDGRTARLPVEGTIARGMLSSDDAASEIGAHESYMYKTYYAETYDDYARAGKELKNPIKLSDEVLSQGKRLYLVNCQVCHGATGDGKGSIVETGAFPPVPNYKVILNDKPEGMMFHSITYGKNLMGSYSAQLTAEERWKVIYYIQKLAGVGRFGESANEAASTSEGTATN